MVCCRLNLRESDHIFKVLCSAPPAPQIREENQGRQKTVERHRGRIKALNHGKSEEGHTVEGDLKENKLSQIRFH